MYDVVALGELLIDFTPAGFSDNGHTLFEMNPGGAPANVLSAVTKLGGNGAFIGKVGSDQFGYFLNEVLKKNKINTDGLKFTKKANTTLAFVHLNYKGDRSFTFYRNPGADTMLEEEDIKLDLIENGKIFHFGSLSMTDEPSKSATLKAIEYAKQNKKIISYDPNLRLHLWKNEIIAKKRMILGLQYADIVKLSEEELQFLTEESNLEYGSKMLLDMGIKLVLVTLGANGCYYRHILSSGHVPAYHVNVVDTTGAGDAFLGAILYNISNLDYNLEKIKTLEIRKIIDFANAAGGLCTTKRGAIPAMPTLEEVKYCVDNCSKNS
ncbi:carbohydrate kinase family protein [Thermoanaerobacterium thermosaccharolyticum]|uniref:Sugar kinase n=1 Tax=Thermoanaerobacterium thermosaccharolyticum TaxID=1517 RepID=A0A223I0L6_THETR|nr:carbohydrate kinase [Thermoanaerobacterium thermosaccharolyticum]AST58286.1 sugar kinase [Thermoanaerobacterium thermosaccharolyticum]MBE0067606.1 carbohydrate kinase [Thermoanaerobacterium thermosaccharolyticum]MBE0227190.1 carbohydrate kinase [Thermoanaerobacterium thermosaccharolyticum]